MPVWHASRDEQHKPGGKLRSARLKEFQRPLRTATARLVHASTLAPARLERRSVATGVTPVSGRKRTLVCVEPSTRPAGLWPRSPLSVRPPERLVATAPR